jgi:hypothetical protein
MESNRTTDRAYSPSRPVWVDLACAYANKPYRDAHAPAGEHRHEHADDSADGDRDEHAPNLLHQGCSHTGGDLPSPGGTTEAANIDTDTDVFR